MKIISKELLGEVLNKNVTEVYFHKKHGWKFKTHKEENGWISDSDTPLPNIYNLIYECKMYALSKGYEVVHMANTTKIYRTGYEVYNVTNTKVYCLENFFEACEWVRKEAK